MIVQDSISMSETSIYTQRNQIQPIRIGVIGVGNMGQHHARVLSLMKDVELVGVADINVERGLETASRYKVKFFEDYCDLLTHVDAVCIAVPTRLHYAVGINCLLAGIHLLIEKPIAASISEAESLVNAAAESGCILQIGHIERFSPAFQELSKIIKTEEVLALEAHRMSPYSNRANDVSVVLDLMIHDIDLLLELAGAPVVKLTSAGSRALESGCLDYVSATLGFANGIIATLTASKVTHRKIRSIVAHCKSSFTEADFLQNEILIHRHTAANSMNNYKKAPYKQDELIEKVSTSKTDKLGAELEHFVNCVRGGNQPSVGGEQGLKALRLASLIEQIALEDRSWNLLDWQSDTKRNSLTPIL
ncbi:MAG: Gfo/Idh/MocA family oxidoreductase [Richelia sp.]|nr:Gfo/Idh/MocA family oxidoreductase [Richelia sp.]